MGAEQRSGQVLLLGGEPGAGKTRLAAEAACALHEQGVAVLVGTATRDAGVPYQPFVEMLDHPFRASEPGTLTEPIADGATELRRLSRYVDRHVPGSAAPAEPAGDGRRDLLEAVAGLSRRLAADRPLALVLDDLHWAQLPTIVLLEHVVHACLDTPTLVLGAFRTTAPDRSDELSARLADLHRLDCVRRLDLGGLDTEAIAEFVHQHTGVSPARARASAAILRDRTGGNPFFRRETWIDLERHGGMSALRGPQRVPTSLGDTPAARVSGTTCGRCSDWPPCSATSSTSRRSSAPTPVLWIKATAEHGGDHQGGSACDRNLSLDAVDAAIEVGLLQAVDDTPGRYGFVHALTRQAVLDRLPRARRTALHAAVAQALEAHGDAATTARVAHHYLAANVLGFHEQALRAAVAAGREAAHSFAFEEAAQWFDRAATLPETEDSVRAELLFDAAANHVRAGDFARARVVYERLAGMADPLVRLQAAMGLEEANARPGLSDSRAADLLTSRLADCALAPDDLLHIRALGNLGRALAFAGRVGEAHATGSRAIELARGPRTPPGPSSRRS